MKRTKTQETYIQLRDQILDGIHRPGSQLRIDLIAQTFGVSTGAVREALSRLTSDGLVVNPPQRGYEVTAVSPDDLDYLTQARTQIELTCLALSLTHGDVAWEGQLLSSYHILSRTTLAAGGNDPMRIAGGWTTAHDAFHDALVAACPNPWWLQMRRLLYIQAERYRRMVAPFAEGARDIDAEHRALMQAALDRDIERAQHLFADHIRLTAQILNDSGALRGP